MHTRNCSSKKARVASFHRKKSSSAKGEERRLHTWARARTYIYIQYNCRRGACSRRLRDNRERAYTRGRTQLGGGYRYVVKTRPGPPADPSVSEQVPSRTQLSPRVFAAAAARPYIVCLFVFLYFLFGSFCSKVYFLIPSVCVRVCAAYTVQCERYSSDALSALEGYNRTADILRLLQI